MKKLKKSKSTLYNKKKINKSLIAVLAILIVFGGGSTLWFLKEVSLKPKMYNETVSKLPKIDLKKLEEFDKTFATNEYIQNIKTTVTGGIIHFSFTTKDDLGLEDAKNVASSVIKDFDKFYGLPASVVTPEFSELYDSYDANVVVLKSKEANDAQKEFPLFAVKKNKVGSINFTIYGRYEIPAQ